MSTTTVLEEHIKNKIQYHEKLRVQHEATEEYEQCAYHRDEILRLKKMLDKRGYTWK